MEKTKFPTDHRARNADLAPGLILLGSLLVPVTFVVWAFESWKDSTPRRPPTTNAVTMSSAVMCS